MLTTKRVIAVFEHAHELKSRTECIERAGYHICAATNMLQLAEVLHKHCEVVVIGPKIPATEKLRIARFVRERSPGCRIIEIVSEEKAIPFASRHVPMEDNDALVSALM